jgi:hypothetical protein
MWRLRQLGIVAFLATACGDQTEPAPATAAPTTSASVAAVPAAPTSHLPEAPSSSDWPLVYFAPMKIAYRRAPSMVAAEPTMTQDAATLWSSEIWSLSTELKTGVAIHIVELGPKSKHDRASWLKTMQEGALPGEILSAESDVVVKRSRVLGKKARDGTPALSDTHLDFAVCKKLGDTDYCLHVNGGVDLAMGKPALGPEEAIDMVVVVRSLERANEAPPPAASASAVALPKPKTATPLTK